MAREAYVRIIGDESVVDSKGRVVPQFAETPEIARKWNNLENIERALEENPNIEVWCCGGQLVLRNTPKLVA